nr:IscS subfamily cysteine desulfurase [Metabacillus schmidteae]
MIYFDYAATTPMSEHALTIYVKAAKNAFGNSSSLHDVGDISARTLTASRKVIANIINGYEKGIYFTSGGSEANIVAVQSLLNGIQNNKHIITTATEHSSLHTFFKMLELKGYHVTYLHPNHQGVITPDQVQHALQKDTALVSIQHGNSEIGTINPIEDISLLLREKKIIFHSDCVQTFGKIPIDAKHIDAISISGHKIYGPKGVGAAYINPSVLWHPLIPGTTHESGFRPGTVDVPAIAAFATAASDISLEQKLLYDHFVSLRNQLIELLAPYHDKISVINTRFPHTLPNIIPLLFKGIEGQYVMLEANRFGMAISTGSACQVGMQAPSRSILAIGYNEQQAKQYVRISLGKDTTSTHIEKLSKVLINIVENFRK